MFLIIFISFRREYPDFGIWLHRTARRAGGYQVDNLLCATVISATHGLQSYLLSKPIEDCRDKENAGLLTRADPQLVTSKTWTSRIFCQRPLRVKISERDCDEPD
jgi:hypothetical protein